MLQEVDAPSVYFSTVTKTRLYSVYCGAQRTGTRFRIPYDQS